MFQITYFGLTYKTKFFTIIFKIFIFLEIEISDVHTFHSMPSFLGTQSIFSFNIENNSLFSPHNSCSCMTFSRHTLRTFPVFRLPPTALRIKSINYPRYWSRYHPRHFREMSQTTRITRPQLSQTVLRNPS